MSEDKKEVKIGCGCLSDIIAIFLLIILCDLLGCEWCNGFTNKIKNIFKTDNQVQQIRPSEFK